MQKFGGYIFLALLVLIVALSWLEIGIAGPIVATVFAIFVGLVNISEKEGMKLLLAVLVLTMAGTGSLYIGLGETLGSILGPIFTNVGLYFVIIGVIFAVKVIFFSAKSAQD